MVLFFWDKQTNSRFFDFFVRERRDEKKKIPLKKTKEEKELAFFIKNTRI